MSEEPVAPSAGLTAERASSLLVFVTRSLVRDGKDQVTVRHNPPADSSFQLTVTVPPGELGKVIGRGGRTANSIRTLIGAMAARSGMTAQIEFTDGRRPARSPRPGNSGPRRGGGRRDDRGGRRPS